MAQQTITKAFESWLVDRTVAGEPARADKMVFALIPGQNENTEIDRLEGMPSADKIRYTADITRYGALNDNAVVYSVVLDTRVGNWTYNWVGLIDSLTNTVLMIVHLPVQTKVKTENGQQGNNLIRNLSMEFDGAAVASAITVTPETWQIDFAARLFSSDEQTRLANVDYYGPSAFQGDSFKVSVSAGKATIQPGLAYVGGLRCALAGVRTLAITANTSVWVDVSWSGTATGAWANTVQLRAATALADYVDALGVPHYVAKIASLAASVPTDTRPPFPTDAIKQEIADLDFYTREQSNERFQPIGDYALVGDAFTKTESNARFLQVANNLNEIATAGTEAKAAARGNLDIHSKEESDGRFVKKAGDDGITGVLKSTAEFQTAGAQSYRIANASYGSFWRQDSNDLYLLLTNKNDAYGNFNDFRPLKVNLATGMVEINGARPYSKSNCPFPIGYVMLMGNEFDPRTEYPGTNWRDLNATMDGRVIALGYDVLATGGSNSVTLAVKHLAKHSHGLKAYHSNTALDGGWSERYSVDDSQATVSNGLVTETGEGEAFSVQNAYVHFRAWMRIA